MPQQPAREITPRKRPQRTRALSALEHHAAVTRIGKTALLLAKVCELAVEPSLDALSEARRHVSAVHRDLHADGLFVTVSRLLL